MTSSLEARLAWQITIAGLPLPEVEYKFHPVRRWRFDFCWPQFDLAAEVEGATWAQGRHTRGSGFAADCEKYNEAVLMGYRVLRFTAEMIESGQAIEMITKAIGGRDG